MTGPLELPARPLMVPAGTLLRLADDEWTDCRDLTPGTDIAVVLSAVRTDAASNGWAWVIGHRPQCEYAGADEHLPCLALRVRTSVLARHGCPP